MACSVQAFAGTCASGGAEAQGFFIVTSVDVNEQGCRANLKVDWSQGENSFKENPNCPLDFSEIQNTALIDVACRLQAGSELSGVLVLTDGLLHLE